MSDRLLITADERTFLDACIRLQAAVNSLDHIEPCWESCDGGGNVADCPWCRALVELDEADKAVIEAYKPISGKE